MDCFCKGAFVGVITGMVAGAIIVSKNKNLSNIITFRRSLKKSKNSIYKSVYNKFNESA